MPPVGVNTGFGESRNVGKSRQVRALAGRRAALLMAGAVAAVLPLLAVSPAHAAETIPIIVKDTTAQ